MPRPYFNVTATINGNDEHVFLMPADNARSAVRKVLGALMHDGHAGDVLIRAEHSEGKRGALDICERRTTLRGK